jgi:hypothetical protein
MKSKFMHQFYSKRWFILFIAILLLAGGLYLWNNLFMKSDNLSKTANNLEENQNGDTQPVPGGNQNGTKANNITTDTERYKDNGDQTVTDKKTGLIWQKAEVVDVSLEQAKQSVGELSVGGYNDWRMPTILELLSIVDTSLNKPPFSDMLGSSESEYFWSSESTPGVTDRAWVLNAGGGIGNKPIDESHAAGGDKIYSLKCVRGNMNVPTTRFIDNGDGTVSDNLQKIVWMQSTASDLSISEAESYIDKLNEKDTNSWRLPTMIELAMICDRSQNNPAVDKKYFSSISTDKYWTSSVLSSGGRQWYVDLSNGMTTYDSPEIKHGVIAVRTMS